MPDRNDFLKIDSLSFEKAFKEYYAPLFQQAFRFVQRTDIAEELVQEVFVQLWEKTTSDQDQIFAKILLIYCRQKSMPELLKAGMA